jgi:ATP-dependent DNA ligase
MADIPSRAAGERKHMVALLVGVYENGKLKSAGRVGTGFSEKLLKALSVELNKIAVKACPFYNLPATGRGSGSRANRRRNEAVYLGEADACLPSEVYGADSG